MFCDSCLEKVANKLLADDIVILEYLLNNGSIIPQCAISREIIRDDLKKTSHKCYTAISRLEWFGFIDRQIRSKGKYYITESGRRVLNLIEHKLEGAV